LDKDLIVGLFYLQLRLNKDKHRVGYVGVIVAITELSEKSHLLLEVPVRVAV